MPHPTTCQHGRQDIRWDRTTGNRTDGTVLSLTARRRAKQGLRCSVVWQSEIKGPKTAKSGVTAAGNVLFRRKWRRPSRPGGKSELDHWLRLSRAQNLRRVFAGTRAQDRLWRRNGMASKNTIQKSIKHSGLRSSCAILRTIEAGIRLASSAIGFSRLRMMRCLKLDQMPPG